MNAEVSLAGRADWLGEKHLQKLLAALKEGGEEARVAGGAVRNALIGQQVADIDIATTKNTRSQRVGGCSRAVKFRAITLP